MVDFSQAEIDELLEVCQEFNIDGLVCSNTSVSRQGLKTQTGEAGGLSGRPLKQRATEMIRRIHKAAPQLKIVGLGGVFTAEDAYEKIKAGASLVQIYTGFIYQGPLVVKRINQGLLKLMARDGFTNISQAVGAGPLP